MFTPPGPKNHTFRIFPTIFGTWILLEKSEKYDFLLQGAWTIVLKVNFLKTWFWQIGVFTKYGCFYASEWPQIPQKWVNTTPFGSGHTLGTLNHGLGPLFCCFTTLFGARGSLDPPGAPWHPPGPPGAPKIPGMSSWVIVSHSGSLWVIFDPSGVNNSSVYTATYPHSPPTLS